MCKISIIIPAFNAEKTLTRCIESVLSQTIDDIELILIDDGSIDNSLSICDKFSIADHRVRVIHQQNLGAAAARNVGITQARGEYLAFCDSDDLVSKDWLKHMLDFADEKTLPICSYCYQINEIGQEKKNGLEAGKTYNRANYLEFRKAGIAGYLCNALYSKKTIDRIGLRLRSNKEKGDYNEDLIFAVTYITNIDSIVYTGYSDYLYDVREGSLSRGVSTYYFDKYVEKYHIWDSFINDFNPTRTELRREISTETLYHFIAALRGVDSLKEIKRILNTSEVQRCLSFADTSRENRYEVSMVRNKEAILLFCFYKLLGIKGRINL